MATHTRLFYGPRFRDAALPKSPNIESVAKDEVLRRLQKATRETAKGEYHKIKHATPLLERLDLHAVRRRAPGCDRLCVVLSQYLAGK